MNHFNFLKLNIKPKINVILNSNKLQSNLYFTNSFKELIKFKYNFTKKEKDKKRNYSQATLFKNKTKYLKTKSKIIQYKDDHLIKDIYKKNTKMKKNKKFTIDVKNSKNPKNKKEIFATTFEEAMEFVNHLMDEDAHVIIFDENEKILFSKKTLSFEGFFLP